MFDAQIALALFAAFLLGVVAGSGMEIIVRAGRHWIPTLSSDVNRHHSLTPPTPIVSTIWRADRRLAPRRLDSSTIRRRVVSGFG
jgi:hypothetical protein